MNFEVINGLPIYDLYTEFNSLLESGAIRWIQWKGESIKDQICINSVKGQEDNYLLGRGSLVKDWDKTWGKTTNKEGNLTVPDKPKTLQESDFTELCTAFKGTLFEEVYNTLTSRYSVGRVRIMNLRPKTGLTWHQDDTYRIHYPMKTQEGCLMIIEDEVKHLTEKTWWKTNTVLKHTAFNGSTAERLHLVATILD